MNLSKPSDDFVSSGLPNPMHTPVLDPSTLDDEAQVPSSMGSDISKLWRILSGHMSCQNAL